MNGSCPHQYTANEARGQKGADKRANRQAVKSTIGIYSPNTWTVKKPVAQRVGDRLKPLENARWKRIAKQIVSSSKGTKPLENFGAEAKRFRFSIEHECFLHSESLKKCSYVLEACCTRASKSCRCYGTKLNKSSRSKCTLQSQAHLHVSMLLRADKCASRMGQCKKVPSEHVMQMTECCPPQCS